MYLRTVKGTNADYLYLVEGYRENGKVKQKTLLSFGKIEDLNPEQLTDMALKLLNLCPDNALIDLNSTEEIARKNWGIPAVIEKLWETFNLEQLFNNLLKSRKLKYDLASAVKLMLADRLNYPCSKYKTYINQEYYHNLPNIGLQELYRALNELDEYKEDIEKHLLKECKSKFELNLDVVFFDVTTFYFESTSADELRNFGYGKDGKFNEVQIVLSLLITKEGLPVGFDIFSGNTYEGNTLESALIKLKQNYKINKIIIVADRGLNTGLNLNKIKEHEFEYIVGCRIKNVTKSLQESILDLQDYATITAGNNEEIVKYKVINYERTIKDQHNKKINTISEKLICTWSSKRARKDQKDRVRLIEKAKDLLSKNKLANKRGAKKYIKTSKNTTAVIDDDKILEDAKWDGFYAIETSDDSLTPELIMSAYHTLWKIEESFRIYKSHLEARPIYHWTQERIKGHFVLSYIAFLFERTLEIKLKATNNTATPNNIREALNHMEFTELQYNDRRYPIYAKCNSLGEQILKVLNISHPKKS